MWHLMLSLFLITSVALSVVSATSFQPRQAPSPDLKFTCPKELSNSLCCSNDLQSNGAVKDCQESRYLFPNPESDNGYATSVDRCTTSQMNAGYDTPVCCHTKVRTYKFDNGAPIFIGVNCMDPEDVSVGLEKRQIITSASKTVPQPLDINKFTKFSPLDHRQDQIPSATLSEANIRGLPTFYTGGHADSAQTPTPLWRTRSTRKMSRRNLKRASKSKNNSVANTILNDLNSASSRAIVRNAAPKVRRSTAARVASKPAAEKQARQVGGLTQTLTGLLGFSNGTIARSVSRWTGLRRREVQAMFARFV